MSDNGAVDAAKADDKRIIWTYEHSYSRQAEERISPAQREMQGDWEKKRKKNGCRETATVSGVMTAVNLDPEKFFLFFVFVF